ncbi:MAG: HDOD domain-containing protein [FCB group bacterium]|jgi:putative nucleotidyltransferase with HDIG domain|nr:HDOD domain-containing protein [FCB group bacterium]
MPSSCASNVQDRIRSIPELATLPETVSQVLFLLQDESYTALDLAAVIESNSTLASQILRLINSPAYGLERGVCSIPDAAILLGFDEVERMALGVSIVTVFGANRTGVKTLGPLWRHSLATAIAAQVIERHNHRQASALQGAHVAALLHDIGKVAIIQYLPEARDRIMRLLVGGATVPEAERDALDGVTHCDVGAWLAEGWGLPATVVDGILRHHDPQKAAEDEPMVHATHVANCLAKSQGHCAPVCDPEEAVHPFSASIVGLNSELANRVVFTLGRCRCLMGAFARGDMFSPHS